ncbi:MAG TPA: AMP-binding protein, partial [Thermodesulfobacteriota bacterium]|nr:AMP-binding protein [Thermodesulfobacteriota bacterium]
MEEQLWHKYKWPSEVPHSLTYEPKPLFKVLEETAQKYPTRTYTIFADHEQTYRQILDMADRVATFLVQKGIQRGDRVALFLPNVPHFPVTFFGALKSGAVCVTCNPLYKANELNFQLKDCGAKALFVLDHPVIYPTALEALKGTDVQTVVVCSVKDFLPPIKAVLGGLLGKIPKAPALDPKHLLFKEVLKTPSSPPKLDINPVEDLAL